MDDLVATVLLKTLRGASLERAGEEANHNRCHSLQRVPVRLGQLTDLFHPDVAHYGERRPGIWSWGGWCHDAEISLSARVALRRRTSRRAPAGVVSFR
jgi:hypothetical protein